MNVPHEARLSSDATDAAALAADDEDQEVHIAGIVIHVQPHAMPSVAARLPLIRLAELHAASNDGRMIVTLEGDSARALLDIMDALRALPEVLNVTLVYQHAESRAALDEVIET